MKRFLSIGLVVVCLLFAFPTAAQDEPANDETIIANVVLYSVCETGWQLYNFNTFEVTLDWYYQTFDDHGSSFYADWTYPMVKGGSFALEAASADSPSVTDFTAPHAFDINVTVHGAPTMPDASGYMHDETTCPDDFQPRLDVHPAESPPAPSLQCADVLDIAGVVPGQFPYPGGSTFEVRLGSQRLPVATITDDGRLGAVFCSDQWLEGLVYEGFVDGARAISFQALAWPQVLIVWLDEAHLNP